jgi:stress response protein SCP2
MAINLTKGQTIDLRKETHDLDRIVIGLGWKIRQQKTGFWSGLLGGGDNVAEFDLDAIAFLLDANGKLRFTGNERLVGSDVIFFNNLRHSSGLIYHCGDKPVGSAGAKDDEQIVVKLNALPSIYDRILFLVSIYRGNAKKQHFGQIERPYIRAVDGKGREMLRYELSSDPAYEGRCTMVFGEVYRGNGGWKFRALGDAHPFDSIVYLLKDYLP